MKKLLPILLLTSLLLSACSLSWNNKEDVFQKKQECLEYRSKVSEYLDKNWYNSTKIKEIFYSSKWNSCYFIAWTNLNNIGERNFLFDYLANKLVGTQTICSENSTSYCKTEEIENENNNYLKQIKFLKWE